MHQKAPVKKCNFVSPNSQSKKFREPSRVKHIHRCIKTQRLVRDDLSGLLFQLFPGVCDCGLPLALHHHVVADYANYTTLTKSKGSHRIWSNLLRWLRSQHCKLPETDLKYFTDTMLMLMSTKDESLLPLQSPSSLSAACIK